ncbi:DotU family type IV/VI secretion system protein [Citrobacter freundii]|nr:DotU family type IV/VI secretion system protein [Citrobacter freundii]
MNSRLPYTQCALLDESVLNRNRQDSGYITWLATPLQARYFNTTNAGEELWERIRTVLREPVPDIAVLTCFYRAVTLGFVGRYREQGDERREDVLEALAAQAMPFKLKHDAPVVIRASGFSGGQRRWWSAWVVGAVTLGAMWLVFSHVLQEQVTLLIGQG